VSYLGIPGSEDLRRAARHELAAYFLLHGTVPSHGEANMDDPIAEGCITDEELATWLKLVERNILKGQISKPTVLPEPSDPASFSRTTLAIVATFAASVTLAWLTFLVWLAYKGISLF
jgi:hypothetical protein